MRNGESRQWAPRKKVLIDKLQGNVPDATTEDERLRQLWKVYQGVSGERPETFREFVWSSITDGIQAPVCGRSPPSQGGICGRIRNAYGGFCLLYGIRIPISGRNHLDPRQQGELAKKVRGIDHLRSLLSGDLGGLGCRNRPVGVAKLDNDVAARSQPLSGNRRIFCCR